MNQLWRRIVRATIAATAVMLATGQPLSIWAASIGDVFVIMMENHNFTQPGSYTSTQAIFGNANAPYLNSLITANNPNAAQTSWASNYTSLGSGIHPSEPNYIWTEAGTNFGITNDNDPYPSNSQNTNQHLSGLMALSGISWKSYQEDIDMNLTTGAVNAQSSWTVPLSSFSGTMPGGATANAYNGTRQYNYAAKHNPPLFFADTNGGNNSTTSNTQRLNYAPLQQLQTDLTNNTVSRLNWITPDQYNDMHTSLSGGFTYNSNHLTGDSAQIAQGDNFLSIIVPQIMSSQAYQNNGAILIWFDETEGGDTSDFTIPYVLISPLAKGNAYQSTANFTHSSTLRTLQEILQVAGGTATGFLGGAATANDQSDMFQAGVIPTGLPDPIWNGGGSDNNWSTANNWQKTPAAGSNITFAGANRLTSNNDTLSSVGSITFSSTAGAYSLTGNAVTVSGGITNNSTSTQTIGINLTLSAAQQFNAASGNLAVNGTIATGGNTLTVTGSSNATLAGIVSGTGRLVKSGVGTLTASGNNSYSGGTTVSAGTLVVGHVNGLGTGGLTINSNSTTRLQANLGGPVQLSSLSVAGDTAPTGTLDITDNNLIVHNGNLATLTAQIKKGLNAGGTLWTGPGITSSTAAADSGGITAVGIIPNDDGAGGALYSTWPVGADSGGAVAVTNTDVLIKYTYFGDADMNGVVDSTTDYSLWLTGSTSGGSLGGWLYGDFNYDGVVDNADDYSLWLTGYTSQTGPLIAGRIEPVPEPSTLLLAASGLAMANLRLIRRRHST